MKRKGFTLIELLVVIAIIALLMGILMPVLSKVKALANRVICGANLSGIGKAMAIYANEQDQEYPVAGGDREAIWATAGKINRWYEKDVRRAFGTDPAMATITSCFYLLVRHADVGPGQFICKGDAGARVFEITDFTIALTQDLSLPEVWDFGGDSDGMPGDYCSYSYHLPLDTTKWPGYPITPSSNPGCPLCADRNPYLDKNAEVYVNNSKLDEPFWEPKPIPAHYADPDKKGNAAAHQRDGQNVLFNDGHVSFEEHPNVGIDNDNIWIRWLSTDEPDPEGKQVGSKAGRPRRPGQDAPKAEKDAFLVCEENS